MRNWNKSLTQTIDRTRDIMIIGQNGCYDHEYVVSKTESFYDKGDCSQKYGMKHLASGGLLLYISTNKDYDDSEEFGDDLLAIINGADVSLVEAHQLFIFDDMDDFLDFN